jgi:hypothetical protein
MPSSPVSSRRPGIACRRAPGPSACCSSGMSEALTIGCLKRRGSGSYRLLAHSNLSSPRVAHSGLRPTLQTGRTLFWMALFSPESLRRIRRERGLRFGLTPFPMSRHFFGIQLKRLCHPAGHARVTIDRVRPSGSEAAVLRETPSLTRFFCVPRHRSASAEHTPTAPGPSLA